MKNKALLAVSFGTSYSSAREKAIGGIESALALAFPDYDLLRVFTHAGIIRKIRETTGECIPNVAEALSQLQEQGYTEVLVQPLLILDGVENEKIQQQSAPFKHAFERIDFGTPLLASDKDIALIADFLNEQTVSCAPDTALVFMGHGTERSDNAPYIRLAERLTGNAFLGTMEARPSLDEVLSRMKINPAIRHVALQPFMLVAGEHACRNMASDEPDSWRSLFEAAGYEVSCRMKGLGEYEALQALFVQHAAHALKGKL